MARNGLVVAGIDIAKDKADVSIRALSQRQTFPSTAEGRRQLIAWLRKHKVTKAVMEASGGYERGLAKALREKDIEVRIVDPKRVRHFAQSCGRLAKNDVIDADTIAWFACFAPYDNPKYTIVVMVQGGELARALALVGGDRVVEELRRLGGAPGGDVGVAEERDARRLRRPPGRTAPAAALGLASSPDHRSRRGLEIRASLS